jgi:predicted porin
MKSFAIFNTHKFPLSQLFLLLALGTAGATHAQSSVTLYGVLDADLTYRNISYVDAKGNDLSGTRFGMDNGVQSGNRLGVKGIEDLGGGNQVAFVLESGFDLGNGTSGQSSRLFGRQAWLGVQNNDWGNLRVGRQTSVAYSYVGVAVDPFVQGFAQANMASSFPTTNNVRYDNLVRVETAVLQGFQAALGYSFATGMKTDYLDNKPVTSVPEGVYNYSALNNSTAITFGLKYANGPFYGFATYDQVNPNQNLVQNSTSSVKTWLAGASYDFQVVKAVAAFGQTRDGAIGSPNSIDSIVNGKSVAAAGSLNNQGSLTEFSDGVNWNAYLLGLTAPVSSTSKVFASWQLATPTGNLKSKDLADISTGNQNVYSLGYQYDFSKRTNLYSYVSYANNYGFVSSYKSTVLGVGLRHMF